MSAADGITALGLAILMSQVGLEDVGAEVLRRVVPYGSLVDHDPQTLGQALMFASVTSLMSVARAIADHRDPSAASKMTQFGLLLVPPDLSPAEADAITRWYEDFADERYEARDLSAAQANYRLGNWYFGRARYPESAARYERAIAADSRYGERPYFWSEYAAALFETGRYPEAITWYERAREADPSPDVHAWLADCYLRNGNYSEALRLFAEYLERSRRPSDSWTLTTRALIYATHRTGIEEQTRDPDAAAAELPEPDVMPTIEQIERAWANDLLCGPAWESLISPCFVDPDGSHGRDCSGATILNVALVLAVLIDDIDFYDSAVVAAADQDDQYLLDSLIRYGVKRNDSRWPSRLLDRLEDADPELQTIVQRSLTKATAVVPVHETTLRIHNADGTWESLTVGHTR
jgi:pentatricopeptide repeat protein